MESISGPNLPKTIFRRTRGSNPRPSAHQAEAHLTELVGLFDASAMKTAKRLLGRRPHKFRGNVNLATKYQFINEETSK